MFAGKLISLVAAHKAALWSSINRLNDGRRAYPLTARKHDDFYVRKCLLLMVTVAGNVTSIH